MELSYGKSLEAWEGFKGKVEHLIRDFDCKSICEIGGGANPLLDSGVVKASGIDYVVLDISADELAKAPADCRKIEADVCAEDFVGEGNVDFAFSKMLAEHVRDGKTFHSNVGKILRPGGIAFHFFPTLYAAPFIANKLLPETLADSILDLVAPRNRYRQGKFKAYYSWCRGPTPPQLRRLQSVGFEILEYKGFFGHEYYYQKIPPVSAMSRALTDVLIKHPNPYLTSFAYVVLRKK